MRPVLLWLWLAVLANLIILVNCMDAVRSLKVPTFSGRDEDFQLWWMRFCAYAALMKFALAIGKRPEADMPAGGETELPTDTDEAKAARNRNLTAMYNFTLAFTSESLLAMIFGAQTSNWPSGRACDVVVALFRRYKPDDQISRMEMKTQLSRAKLANKENPTNLFDAIRAIENKYNNATRRIDREDVIAQVFVAAPERYQPLLLMEQQSKGSTLTLQHLETTMLNLWRATTGRNNTSESSDGVEVSFVSQGNRWNNKNKGKGNPNKGRKCFLCGKLGHIRANCWELESNASRRPNNWKSSLKTEVGAVSTSNKKNGIEVCFCSPTTSTQVFPDDLKLLNDPNVFIADSAATYNMSKYAEGMYDWKDSTTRIRVANGSYIHPKKIAKKMPSMLCDNTGKGLFKVGVTDVAWVPECPYNVISITKYMKNGWKLTGDEDHLTLSKGGIDIRFDIKISTSEE